MPPAGPLANWICCGCLIINKPSKNKHCNRLPSTRRNPQCRMCNLHQCPVCLVQTTILPYEPPPGCIIRARTPPRTLTTAPTTGVPPQNPTTASTTGAHPPASTIRAPPAAQTSMAPPPRPTTASTTGAPPAAQTSMAPPPPPTTGAPLTALTRMAPPPRPTITTINPALLLIPPRTPPPVPRRTEIGIRHLIHRKNRTPGRESAASQPFRTMNLGYVMWDTNIGE